MKDEIKKKIEDEALVFSKSNYADSIPDGLVDLLSFKKGAEYGYSLAQQSVNSELDFYANELNRERIKTYTDLSERYLVTLSSIRDIFDAGLNFAADKYKAILSASQNTVSNEGEKCDKCDNEGCIRINLGDVVSSVLCNCIKASI